MLFHNVGVAGPYIAPLSSYSDIGYLQYCACVAISYVYKCTMLVLKVGYRCRYLRHSVYFNTNSCRVHVTSGKQLVL